MKIGDIAAAAGVPSATVRFYERRGLLPPPPRTTSGYRTYGAEAARRLQFIRHAQGLGFSLDEIQKMLELRTDDAAGCQAVEALTRAKVASVRKHLLQLQRLERTLTQLVQKCGESHDPASCPILDVIASSTSGRPSSARRTRHA